MQYQERLNFLTSELEYALSSKTLTYAETKTITTCGIYLIFKGEEVIYVGKTNRDGKTRLRELAADYRSHTLNRKFLRLLVNETLKADYPPFRKETKAELIDGDILTEESFVSLQAQVNLMIREELQFKFHRASPDEVIPIEHFFIAVLNPRMND